MAWPRGKSVPPDVVQKRAAGGKKRWQEPAFRRKMADARRAVWANPKSRARMIASRQTRPPEFYELVYIMVDGGQTYTNVAAVLGVSKNTVAGIVYRFRRAANG